MGYRMNPRTGQMEMQGVQHGVDHMKPAPMPYAPHVAGADANGVVQNSVGTWGQPLQDLYTAMGNSMSDPAAKSMWQTANQAGGNWSTANDYQKILDSGSFGGVPIADIMKNYGAGSQGATDAQGRAGLMPQLDPATGQVVNVPATVPGGNIAPPVNSGGSTSPYSSQIYYGPNGSQSGMQPGGYTTDPNSPWYGSSGGMNGVDTSVGTGSSDTPFYAAQRDQLAGMQASGTGTPSGIGAMQYGMQPGGATPAGIGAASSGLMKAMPNLAGLALGRNGSFFNRRMY